MSTTPAAGASNTVAVTVLGLITLLIAGVYLAIGGVLTWGGAAMANDPAAGWGPLLEVFAVLTAVLGVLFLLQGVLGLLAGWGVLKRKRWGRLLTFPLAVLAVMWGLAFQEANSNSSIALGAAQLLYGAFALVVLIRNGDKFSRLRI